MDFQGGFLKQSSAKNTGSVSWTWYDKQKGTVKWTLKNLTAVKRSFVLFRNGYYFGNAYWPIYVANPEFNVKFISIKPNETIPALSSNTFEQNVALLAIINLPKAVKPLISSQTPSAPVTKIVAFVFTLNPNQTYEILEDGFSDSTPPSNARLYEVVVNSVNDYCIKYDRYHVLHWNLKKNASVAGYFPYSSTFNTVEMNFVSSEFLLNSEPPSVALFNDSIKANPCIEISRCEKFIDNAVDAIINGNISGFFNSFLEATGCFANLRPDEISKIFEKKAQELREERTAWTGATAAVSKAMKEADAKLPQPSVPDITQDEN